MHYVALPQRVGRWLAEAPHRRLVVTLNGHEYRRALHGFGDGNYHVRIRRGVLRELGVSEGDTVVMTCRLDGEPDRVDLRPELAAALEQDPEAKAPLEAFTPGNESTEAIER